MIERLNYFDFIWFINIFKNISRQRYVVDKTIFLFELEDIEIDISIENYSV
jgi:hypothetical protein